MPKKERARRRPNRAERAAARQRRRRIVLLSSVIGVLLLAAALVWLVRTVNRPLPGESVPIQGAQHIAFGASHPPYNSDPPTSGWHYDTPLQAGFHDEPAPDEQLVHNLEHGHVVISYDCDKLPDCEEAKQQIRKIISRYNSWKVTAVPRSNADAAIALTAWGRIDKLDRFDEDRIVAFIEAWRNRGPEATAE
ncbi:MAG: hypothetical protein Kow0047_30300 [Anaerolineae bacterium]